MFKSEPVRNLLLCARHGHNTQHILPLITVRGGEAVVVLVCVSTTTLGFCGEHRDSQWRRKGNLPWQVEVLAIHEKERRHLTIECIKMKI